MTALRDRVPAWVRGLRPYEPGMPIEELERRLGIGGSIKIASNENPLGPSPRAVAAIRGALADLHRYPESTSPVLVARLAERHGVDPSSLLVGNGSNELIELLARALLAPGDEAVVSEHAFAVYAIIVGAAGGRVVSVPMDGFDHDLAAMAAAVTDRTKLLFVANPNNPTGTIVRRPAWRAMLAALRGRDVVVVADEAYAEFVEDPAWPDTIAERGDDDPPVVSLRTFSKVYGLAGLRVGYAVGPSEIVDLMGRVRQPFSVNTLAQVAAAAALDDREHVERTLANNRAGMAYLTRELRRLGVPWVPSHANFLLIEAGRGAAVHDRLLRAGVITRPMEVYGFPRHLRVTIGTPDENRRFVEALEHLDLERAS
jgi:histidinol-phosphate aminotransferase